MEGGALRGRRKRVVGFRSIIIFLTVCTHRRGSLLANNEAARRVNSIFWNGTIDESWRAKLCDAGRRDQLRVEGGALRRPLISGSRELAPPKLAAPHGLLMVAAEYPFQPVFELAKEKTEISAG